MGAILTALRDRSSARDGLTLSSQDERRWRMDGRTVLVTGASRGLGRAIATGLGRLGASAHVAVRSLAEETVEAVVAAGASSCSAWSLDLERLESVDALVAGLAADGVRLDRVVLNAGVVTAGSRVTPHGLDVMLQVNALANVQLVDGLLAAGLLAPGARIVVVGSEAHRSAPPMAWGELGKPREYAVSGALTAYSTSKLVLHTWAVELARRLGPDVSVHHICPGAVASDIAREAPWWSQGPLRWVFRWFFQSPEVAAGPVVWLCASPDAVGSMYLHLGRPKAPDARVLNAAEGGACWAASHAELERVHSGEGNDVSGQP